MRASRWMVNPFRSAEPKRHLAQKRIDDALGFSQNSAVLILNAEGATDPISYEAITGLALG